MPGASYVCMSESTKGSEIEYPYCNLDSNSSALGFLRVLNKNLQ